ncbi:MAG: hypothetical protein V4731_12440 [Pseudomonadota bacterium]
MALPAPVWAQTPAPVPVLVPAPAPAVGVIQSAQGLVTVSQGNTLSNALGGSPITNGARIVTTSTGTSSIRLSSGCTIPLSPNQAVTIDTSLSCQAQINNVVSVAPTAPPGTTPATPGVPGVPGVPVAPGFLSTAALSTTTLVTAAAAVAGLGIVAARKQSLSGS